MLNRVLLGSWEEVQKWTLDNKGDFTIINVQREIIRNVTIFTLYIKDKE